MPSGHYGTLGAVVTSGWQRASTRLHTPQFTWLRTVGLAMTWMCIFHVSGTGRRRNYLSNIIASSQLHATPAASWSMLGARPRSPS